MSTTISEILGRKRETIDKAVIRFCGDSGDGMQITGSQFTNTVALYGNDLATFPDYPAEIRAPAGTLPGVSGFQVHFSSSNVYTPGDSVDVLIAMNPAALKMNLPDLKTNGILIVNSDDFGETDLRKAQITVSPLEDHSLDGYRLFAVELTKLTRAALKEVGLDAKSMDRCKNFFALGMCYWLYNRSMEPTLRWLDDKFKNKPQLVTANKLAMQAGYSFCEATEAFQISYEIPPAKLSPGTYRNISGNAALALGFVAASQQAGIPLVPRLLSHHAGFRHPSRALDVQGFRRHHVSSRRRNRRRLFRHRRVLHRRAGHHHHIRSRHGAENRSDRPRRRRRTAAGGLRYSARRSVHRPSHQNRTSRSFASSVRTQFRSSRSRCSLLHRPAIAFGLPSKPAASPSNTWCP